MSADPPVAGAPTPRADDFDRGVANRRAVLGDAWVDRSLGRATAFNADFQSLITRYAWHDIWGRPGLDHDTRRLLVLGMTMGLARWEEFELHCRAAIEHGVSVEKIKETLMQGAIYCGVPAANTAFKIAGELLEKAGLVPPPRPLDVAHRVATHHTFSAPQLKVTIEGSGPPVVLAHALGLDGSMWDDLARELASSCTVLRYDMRGHGGSAVPAGPYTQQQLVDDAARVIREWGVGPVAFVGLSMGGMVAQGLSVQHPQLLRGAVYANTVARYGDEAKAGWQARIAAVAQGGVAAVVETVLTRYLNDDFRREHPEVLAAMRAKLLRAPDAGYLAACHAVAGVDWLDALPSVRTPVLVIAGARDAGAPPAAGQAIAERIAGARFEVIDGASHLPPVETPAAFTALVKGFLAGLDQARRSDP